MQSKPMATRSHEAFERPAPRLYLVTPVVTDPSVIADALAAMVEAADIAAVLLRLADDSRAR